MNSLLSANISCLEQGRKLLEKLPESIYSKACEDVFGSSIGGHMRHNLDHYAAFVTGLEDGMIDYDARDRDPQIESKPGAAIGLMETLCKDFSSLGSMELDRPLKIRMDDGGDSSWSQTSLRRELQFLLSHTIHHYALIVSIAKRFGFSEFPMEFGVAPSTLKFQQQKGA